MSVDNTGQTRPELSGPPPRIPPGSPNGAGQFATAALAAVAAVEVVAALTAIVTLARLPARRAELMRAEVSFADGWEGGLSLAYVGVFLIAVIAWMIWQHQAHANLSALVKTRYSPAVIWLYLVPLLGLVIPYRGVAELARAGEDRPAIRRTWWGAFLLSNAFGGASVVYSNLTVATTRILSVLSSVAALVAALLGMRVIAMVNSGLALRRAEAGWPPGPGPLSRRAILGWATATGALTLVGAAGFGAIFPTLVETLEQAPGARNVDFAVGDCFDEIPDGYEEVSCAGPHYAEAYRIADHPDQAFYPGDTQVANWAEPFCYSHFESYTGVAYQDSALEFGYLYPTEASWNSGDREVVCFLFNLSGEDLTEPVGQPVA